MSKPDGLNDGVLIPTTHLGEANDTSAEVSVVVSKGTPWLVSLFQTWDDHDGWAKTTVSASNGRDKASSFTVGTDDYEEDEDLDRALDRLWSMAIEDPEGFVDAFKATEVL